MLSSIIHIAPLVIVQTVALLALIWYRDPVARDIARNPLNRKDR